VGLWVSRLSYGGALRFAGSWLPAKRGSFACETWKDFMLCRAGDRRASTPLLARRPRFHPGTGTAPADRAKGRASKKTPGTSLAAPDDPLRARITMPSTKQT